MKHYDVGAMESTQKAKKWWGVQEAVHEGQVVTVC
jgi:hypothetical protein